MWLNTPIEIQLREIVHEIEKIGSDEKLTLAIIKITEARELIANYIER